MEKYKKDSILPSLLNPTTAISLYNKTVLTTVLYGSEVWYNLQNEDIDALNKFQPFIVKQIQQLHPRTRSDIAESTCGLYPLPAAVEKSKLSFSRTIMYYG
ncbi:hypothetical protein KUTeg_006113 [Tegillarca granosa]|uniref:Uncharacterized protein n=1 Tax=Tegillarca granosa TaxID=220873 RepID=A0ABQ9FFM3_TEGGR|nr:hypothetical protein KUTeg_006113 [Tegillarca granosa]